MIMREKILNLYQVKQNTREECLSKQGCLTSQNMSYYIFYLPLNVTKLISALSIYLENILNKWHGPPMTTQKHVQDFHD